MSIGLLSSRFGESLFYYRHIAKSKRRINCSSSNHQPCQAIPTLVNIKCSDDPYANVCVPSKVKNMSKVKHLITGVNKTRFLNVD